MRLTQNLSFKLLVSFVCLLVPVLNISAQIKSQPYLMSAEIEENERMNRFISLKSEAYALIGEYDKAAALYSLEYDTRELAGEKTGELSAEELAYFQTFQPKAAIDYILKRAAREQIIIINEAHHRPLHRVFVETLLPGLHERGYRYLGLEALSSNRKDSLALGNDTLLNERGYPLNSYLTGIYTREPQFGNLIRKASRTGYYVFGYERSGFQPELERDEAEAQNVLKILEKDPDAKILLYCGYAHLVETNIAEGAANYGKSQWLAGYLKELTGIDPFTINQEVLTYRPDSTLSPYYPLIETNRPAVLLNDEGKLFNGPAGFDKYDALVYHPNAKPVN
ncbi:MAG: hypothetical protein KDD15_22930, partial [Lewinella sp.]|nr:hypothetical protein [Lewinella sp.]